MTLDKKVVLNICDYDKYTLNTKTQIGASKSL